MHTGGLGTPSGSLLRKQQIKTPKAMNTSKTTNPKLKKQTRGKQKNQFFYRPSLNHEREPLFEFVNKILHLHSCYDNIMICSTTSQICQYYVWCLSLPLASLWNPALIKLRELRKQNVKSRHDFSRALKYFEISHLWHTALNTHLNLSNSDLLHLLLLFIFFFVYYVKVIKYTHESKESVPWSPYQRDWETIFKWMMHMK